MTRTAAVPNYYEVLNVSPKASLEEIRLSFKRQVLETHPDKNPERREWSERRIRELIEAFEIIGTQTSREEFDRDFRARQRATRRTTPRRSKPFYFYKTDPEARALRILHDLTHQEGQKAVEQLWDMESRLGAGFLSRYLDRKDYLDSLFLTAEYHLRERQYREAARRLREFFIADRDARYRRHYFDEVVTQLKDLYLRKLPRFLPAEEILQLLADVDGMNYSPSEERLRFKRQAAAFLEVGREADARVVLDNARKTYPGAKENDLIEAMIAKGAAARC